MSSWRSGLPLTRIKDSDVEAVDRNLILATINTTSENLHAEAKEVNFNANRPVAPKIEYIVEKKNLETALTEAMQGMGNVMPTAKQ